MIDFTVALLLRRREYQKINPPFVKTKIGGFSLSPQLLDAPSLTATYTQNGPDYCDIILINKNK